MMITELVLNVLDLEKTPMTSREIFDKVAQRHPRTFDRPQISKACSNLYKIGRLNRSTIKDGQHRMYKYSIRKVGKK